MKGANYFLAAACENDELSLIALGYAFEKVVLYCTSLGLGTVWLGGTFTKSEFLKAVNLSENEILPIVSPVGYEGGKKSFLGKVFSKNTNKRKDFSEVFFDKDLNTPLELSKSDEYSEPLEMIRLAPSSVNKQPWRVVKDDKNIHFYFANAKTSTIIDMGIAICHFHLSSIENHINGKFRKLNNLENNKDKNLSYVISWISE